MRRRGRSDQQSEADDVRGARYALYAMLGLVVVSCIWFLRSSEEQPGTGGRPARIDPALLALVESHDFSSVTDMKPDELAEVVRTFESGEGEAYIVGAVRTEEVGSIRHYLLIKDGHGVLIRDGEDDGFWGPDRFIRREIRGLKLAYCRYGTIGPIAPDAVAGDGGEPAEWNVLLFQLKHHGESGPLRAFNQPGIEPFRETRKKQTRRQGTGKTAAAFGSGSPPRPSFARYQRERMGRFLREYAGTNWLGWLIIIGILAIPLLWPWARHFSIVWQQMLNFALGLCMGAGFSGTAHSMTGNHAMGIAVFVGFGVGYSVVALRKKRSFERIVGGVCLAFFGSIIALLVVNLGRRF